MHVFATISKRVIRFVDSFIFHLPSVLADFVDQLPRKLVICERMLFHMVGLTEGLVFLQVGKDIVKQFQDAISRSGHQIAISALVPPPNVSAVYTEKSSSDVHVLSVRY